MADSIEQSLGVTFSDKSLLRIALTHSSRINESANTPSECNERLEFLGDAVLGMAIAEELYRRFPNYQEGALTTMRSNIVCGETLAGAAQRLKLGQQLTMGTGEAATGGRARASNLAAAFEAVVGAIFMDKGYCAAKDFCLRILNSELTYASPSPDYQHPKSALQELVQSRHLPLPEYRITDTSGKPHSPTFIAEVAIDGAVLGTGTGSSKSLAEQEAAKTALNSLNEPD